MISITKKLLLGLTISVATMSLEAGVARGRDYKADLITISTRFVLVNARTAHKAGDADEQFIEDVITPSIADVVEKGGVSLTNAQRDAVLGFLVASENSASEEVSSIAANLYTANKIMFCSSLAKLSQSKRAVILERVNSGFASTGKPVPRKICR